MKLPGESINTHEPAIAQDYKLSCAKQICLRVNSYANGQNRNKRDEGETLSLEQPAIKQ